MQWFPNFELESPFLYHGQSKDTNAQLAIDRILDQSHSDMLAVTVPVSFNYLTNHS